MWYCVKAISYNPIGVIHSPFIEAINVPIQASVAKGIKGTVEVYAEYAEGLTDLDGFSHIILLYHLNLIKSAPLMVKPFLDDNLHGVFATRSPARPNPIGISIVRLTKIIKNTLQVEDLDIVDGTPLLDIKPYVPKFDNRRTNQIGWFNRNINKLENARDDGRFCK